VKGGRLPGWSTQANEIVNRVFAYGTFRAGESARAMIAGHIGRTMPATMPGVIYAFPDGYPGMIESEEGTVIGEVLELDELAAAFALLDAYEGDDYEREMREVTLADGSRVWAWCYLLKDPASIRRAERIDSGDWVAYRRSHD
jgi:gamma-glutamylcyclotransferase (GGCT)/AIG2-like uncharacterized protein YtfP